MRAHLCHPRCAPAQGGGCGGSGRQLSLRRTLGACLYRECDTRPFWLRAPQRGERRRVRCRCRLMFIYAALNSPFEYILISCSNYLLNSRFAGRKQIPEKEEQQLGLWKCKEALVWGKAVVPFVPPERWASSPKCGSDCQGGLGRLAEGLISRLSLYHWSWEQAPGLP